MQAKTMFSRFPSAGNEANVAPIMLAGFHHYVARILPTLFLPQGIKILSKDF
jgi:hypothetical protein